MQRDSWSHTTRHLEDLEPAALIGREAGERAVRRLNPKRPRPGKYPVLFDPRVSGSLLGHLAGAISGSSIARKTSFLQDKLGQAVFAGGVAVVDDPLRLRGLRSRPFDGEGVRVSRRELISDGALMSWIAESAAARPAMRPAASAALRARAQATSTWRPVPGLERNCSRPIRRPCSSSSSSARA
jgi:PmbA protein